MEAVARLIADVAVGIDIRTKFKYSCVRRTVDTKTEQE